MSDRAIIAVTGGDREGFLQNLVTNDVERARGGLAYAALLTPQGKYLADFLFKGEAERILVDVAAPLAPALSLLHHHHLAPGDIRPVALAEGYQRMDLVPEEALDRRGALLSMPALIKAYLRLGGVVGDGAFVDRAFNTTDVLLLMDTQAMSARHRRFYEGRGQEP